MKHPTIALALTLIALCGTLAAATPKAGEIDALIDRFEILVDDYILALQSGEAEAMASVQARMDAFGRSAEAYEESDFSPAQLERIEGIGARLATALLASIGDMGLGEMMESIDDGEGTVGGEPPPEGASLEALAASLDRRIDKVIEALEGGKGAEAHASAETLAGDLLEAYDEESAPYFRPLIGRLRMLADSGEAYDSLFAKAFAEAGDSAFYAEIVLGE